jgi:dipeptidyl aminopeptidase/acylaminoacyl peptidase
MRFKLPLGAILAGAALSLPAAAPKDAAPRPATIDDLMKVKNVVDPQLSPDGSRVVYTVSAANFDAGRYDSDLWLVSVKGGPPTRLTNAPGLNSSPRWSPDGKTIAFLSDRGGKAQVWLISPDGGEARKLTGAPAPAKGLAWSPDGKRLAFLATDPQPEDEARRHREKDDVVVIGKGLRADHLHVIDAAGGKARRLTSGPASVVDFAWSPDGAEIAYSAMRSPLLEDLFEVDLFVVTVAGGKERPLVRRPGLDAFPRWSPDGKTIAFVSHDGVSDWIGNTDVCVVPAKGGEPRNLNKALDRSVSYYTGEGPAWSPDGKALHFSSDDRTARHLFALSAETGKVKQLTTGDLYLDRVTWSKDGKRLSCLVASPRRPAEVFVADFPELKFRRLTTTNPHLDGVALPDPKVVRWKGRDGLEIEGLLCEPIGPRKGTRYPLLAYIHGGPQGHFARNFVGQRWTVQSDPFPVAVLTGRGYGVFCPNPRGSGGYGLKFRAANVKDWGKGDLADVLAGIDYLIAREGADPDRLGIMGWSYGGFMTARAIGQSDRFKAASAGAGVTNLESMYGQTDIQPFFERYFGGPPWATGADYRGQSPMRFAARIQAPTLIQHGGNDRRVPLAQSQELHTALRRRGVPVEFAVYPREGHILAEPRHQADAMRRNVAWFERWIPAR